MSEPFDLEFIVVALFAGAIQMLFVKEIVNISMDFRNISVALSVPFNRAKCAGQDNDLLEFSLGDELSQSSTKSPHITMSDTCSH